jgi:hypothetical protein
VGAPPSGAAAAAPLAGAFEERRVFKKYKAFIENEYRTSRAGYLDASVQILFLKSSVPRLPDIC